MLAAEGMVLVDISPVDRDFLGPPFCRMFRSCRPAHVWAVSPGSPRFREKLSASETGCLGSVRCLAEAKILSSSGRAKTLRPRDEG